VSPYRHRQYLLHKARRSEHSAPDLGPLGRALVAQVEAFLASVHAPDERTDR
jgi:hypothetical protein